MDATGWRKWLLALAAACALPLAAPGDAVLDALAQQAPAAQRFDKGLLWKIESPGAPASFVFGTIHIDDPRVTALPQPVAQAFAGATSFTMEVDLNPDAMVRAASRMVYTDGRDLAGVLGPEWFRKTAALMGGLGVPEPLVAKFKPWAAMITLIMPQQRSLEVLDFVLLQMAREQGKPVFQLESADEQTLALDGMPEAEQVALLKYAVENHERVRSDTARLIAAYLARDLGAMWAINESSKKAAPQVAPLIDRLYERLVTERNVRMAERMQPRLREGGAFIAVGAIHLYGEKGVLSLVQRQGYRVSRVY